MMHGYNILTRVSFLTQIPQVVNTNAEEYDITWGLEPMLIPPWLENLANQNAIINLNFPSCLINP